MEYTARESTRYYKGLNKEKRCKPLTNKSDESILEIQGYDRPQITFTPESKTL